MLPIKNKGKQAFHGQKAKQMNKPSKKGHENKCKVIFKIAEIVSKADIALTATLPFHVKLMNFSMNRLCNRQEKRVICRHFHVA